MREYMIDHLPSDSSKPEGPTPEASMSEHEFCEGPIGPREQVQSPRGTDGGCLVRN